MWKRMASAHSNPTTKGYVETEKLNKNKQNK